MVDCAAIDTYILTRGLTHHVMGRATALVSGVIQYTSRLYMYAIRFFCKWPRFSLLPAGLLSRSRLRGTQGVCVYTTAQAWVSFGLCGACSGQAKSHELASNHGIAFRRARAKQDNRTHTNEIREAGFCLFSAPAVYNSSHLAWLPCHLATSHLGPPRVQQQ